MIARRPAERCDGRRASHATLLNDVNEYISAEAQIWRLGGRFWSSGRITGYSESAGINRHVVGDARALQERK